MSKVTVCSCWSSEIRVFAPRLLPSPPGPQSASSIGPAPRRGPLDEAAPRRTWQLGAGSSQQLPKMSPVLGRPWVQIISRRMALATRLPSPKFSPHRRHLGIPPPPCKHQRFLQTRQCFRNLPAFQIKAPQGHAAPGKALITELVPPGPEQGWPAGHTATASHQAPHQAGTQVWLLCASCLLTEPLLGLFLAAPRNAVGGCGAFCVNY